MAKPRRSAEYIPRKIPEWKFRRPFAGLERATLANLAKFFGLKYEADQTPFEALWSISRQAALDAMGRDILAIRRIGEIMGVVAEEDFR